MGNLTRDPELRYTPNGQAVANFGVATNRRWSTPEGERKEEVEFHNLVVWGRQAETINQYLKKGQPIFVEGRLKTQNWEGTDGIKRNRTEIVVDSFQFIGSPSGGQQSNAGQQSPAAGYGQMNNAGNNAGFQAPSYGSESSMDNAMSSPAQSAGYGSNASPDNMNQDGNSADSMPNPEGLSNPDEISIDDIPF